MADKRWVYEARDGAECSVKIKKSSRKEVAYDSKGDVVETVVAPAVYLRFLKPGNGGPARAVIDQAMADHYGYDVEILAKLAEAQVRLGANIFLVQGPGVNEGVKIEATKTTAAAGPTVKQGVRATNDK